MKVYIKVKPKAKENKVTMESENSFVVRVKAEAKNNKANRAVQEALAGYFNTALAIALFLFPDDCTCFTFSTFGFSAMPSRFYLLFFIPPYP